MAAYLSEPRMKEQVTATETPTPDNELSNGVQKSESAFDGSGGSISLESSASFEFDLGEETIPLKSADESIKCEPEARMPANKMMLSGNSLRSVTEQLSQPGREGTLPLSPGPKKRSLVGKSSPFNSPGSLAAGDFQRRTLGRNSSTGILGNGSSHGRPRSPGPLGGSSHGRPRPRSPGPLGGSLHGKSRGPRSRSPGPLGGSLHGKLHPRSSSPGPLSGSNHGRIRSTSPGPLVAGARARSRSPGALLGRSRSFRLQRRQSIKSSKFKGPIEPVSILRRGKFSQCTQPEAPHECSTSPVPSTSSDCDSPNDSFNFRRRISLPRPRRRRVSFWFHDEGSIASSFAAEESIQFGELGFEDSGEFECDGGHEYGQRSMKGELPFIEVMDLAGYGELGLNDEDEYLMNRFNGSTIQEEAGASSGAAVESLSSELSDEELKSFAELAPVSKPPKPRGFFPIPDLDASSHHSSKCQTRPPTPPPTPAQASFSSLLSDDSFHDENPEDHTPRVDNVRKGGSESSLDLSSMKLSVASASETSSGKDLSVASETSSESPTGVAEFDRDEAAEPDDGDKQN